MKKFKKIAACAAALMCAAAMAVSASAKLTTVEQSGYVRSEEGMFLVMLYSDGTYDSDTKAATDYGVDLSKVTKAIVTLQAGDDFTGNFGGSIIMSSKSAADASSRNWPQRNYWGVVDEALGISSINTSEKVQFEKVADHTYAAEVAISGANAVIDDYNFVQFAIQDWGGDVMTVYSIVFQDASGNNLLIFDANGNKVDEVPALPETKAEETTAEEEEAPAETEESEAETTEEAGEEWVSTFDASSVKFDADQAPYYDGLQLALRSDNDIVDSYEKNLGFDITSVYGIRVNVEVDPEDVEHGVWYGGSVGANCPSRGWGQHNFANGDGDELTFDESKGYVEWKSDEPIFKADDAYAFAFFQSWGGPIGVKSFDLLDKNGKVIAIDYNASAAADTAVEEVAVEPTPTEEVELIAPAPAATGDVQAATDSSKGSPDTGVEDVAVAAGLALAAAGAVVIAKKRK